jgi:ATP-dependent helicase/nuclease subunit B
MAFLERIASRFLEAYGSDIHKLVFVFPTRRARLYFLKHLQYGKVPGTALWAPAAFSINDFITQLSGLTISDQLDLIFELYAVYQEHIRSYPRKFEDFYPWGKMIISDFDDIDKYLIDTKELFRALKEFKGVEDIGRTEKSEIYNRYTGFWQDLGTLYDAFNSLLREKNKAYEGMVYREAAENIEGLTSSAEGKLRGDRVIFCGFNALTRSEETIIRHLLAVGKAEVFWDMDRYFVEDLNQEAGYFSRKNREIPGIEEPQWVEDRLWEPKTITIIGVQSKVSQAKVLGLKLRELQESVDNPEHVAVVLPDEALLFPTLNSLPEAVKQVNVTIGYPLQQTPVFSLFDSIMELQLRIIEKGSAEGFYYKDIRKVLNHPYIKPLGPEEIADFMAYIKSENRIYLNTEDMARLSEPLRGLFKICTDSQQLMDFFLGLLGMVRDFFRENKPDLFTVDYEYMYHFHTLLSRLRDSLKNTGLVMNIHTFRQLFKDIVTHSRIPFTGEPLVGLQIMGMLETQTLDFNHLFVLSVNEGHLPPGKSHQSFIPFEVRTRMELPTYKERDAIIAYHFYRLLKHPKNITLIYVTGARGIEKNEKSRFIDQLLIEFAEKNKNARIRHQVIDFSFESGGKKEIAIRKSAEIIEMLLQKTYSSSSLLNYFTCSLKFHFTYILKLQEEEEVYESPDYRLIGNIIHDTLYRLYRPYRGNNKSLSFKDIEDIRQKIDDTLEKTYKEKLNTEDIYTGRNRIALEVMKRLLNNFFDKEKQRPGFKILMLEKEIKSIPFSFSLNGRDYSVRLGGTVDRLDEVGDNIYYIIDYKTGKVDSLRMKSAENFENLLYGQEAVKRKEVFQLFFYRYLLKRSGEYKGDYRLGVYPFKKLYDDLRFVEIDKSDIIDEGLVDRFEEILKGIFRELFDVNIPFVQTGDEKNCQYCPYLEICNREVGQDYFS